MSDLEQLRAELENTQVAYQMAQEINQFKTGFLGRVAHELRSPLSSLISLHQLILFDFCESPEEEKEFLEQAYQSAQKLLAMIDEIILVSKLDYGAIALQIDTVDWDFIRTNLQALTQLQAANRNLCVQINSPAYPVQILTDKDRLLQALLLVIDTGLQTMPKGSIHINLTTDQANSHACIEILIPCSPEIWETHLCQPLELQKTNREQWKHFTESVKISPYLKFLLAQTLFRKMGGELTLSAFMPDEATQETTRLQGWLQLVTPAELNG
ncbi:MAG: HAMP domain-containing sensor histidine kinase [Snowella sp.]|nr:HAMP domain-containing sensor histidine kinase [Snowella sp.]